MPTLDELREAAKSLPDPNSLRTKTIRDASGNFHTVPDGDRLVVPVNGKQVKFNVCYRRGNSGEKVWFYYGAIDVSSS